jgi:hypothetical protein
VAPAPEVTRTAPPRRGDQRRLPRRLVADAARIEAHRSWRIELEVAQDGKWDSVLVGSLSQVRWPRVDQAADCDGRLRVGPPHPPWEAPLESCSCGIYGADNPGEGRAWEFAGWPALAVTGRVLLSGRVFAGSREYRAQRAEIIGPLAVRIGCAVDRCVSRADFAVTSDGTPKPLCVHHVVEHSDGANTIGLAREFAPALYERLESRYGVPVVPG